MAVLVRIARGEVTTRETSIARTVDALKSRGLVDVEPARDRCGVVKVSELGKQYLERGHVPDAHRIPASAAGAPERRRGSRKPDPVITGIQALKEIQGVSIKSTRRALKILVAVAREALRRGHTISLRSNGYLDIYVRKTHSTVAIAERFARIPRKLSAKEQRQLEEAKANPGRLMAKPRAWERGPTGELTVEILERHQSAVYAGRWSDSDKRSPEDHVGDVIAYVEHRAASEETRFEAEQRAREYYRQKAELDRQAAIEQLIADKRAEALKSQIDDWRHAQDIRVYCELLAQRTFQVGEEDAERTREWIEWARQRADAIDPLLRNPPPAVPAIRGWTQVDIDPYLPKSDPPYLR